MVDLAIVLNERNQETMTVWLDTSTPDDVGEIFAALTADPRWHGFGYLGERRNALTSDDPEAPAQPERVAAVDARIIDLARSRGWGYDRLLAWANSKHGRRFGDVMFDGGAYRCGVRSGRERVEADLSR